MLTDREEFILRMTAVIVLGTLIAIAVVMTGLVAIFTDRNVSRAEVLEATGALMICALAGVSWWQTHRRHHWRVNVERNNGGDSGDASDRH